MSSFAPHDGPRFSSRTRDLHASPIREILAVVDRPGMISFAGGLPAADSFPQFSLDAMPRQALQYGASEGDWELRRRIAEDLGATGLRCRAEQVLVLSGSQQGTDLVAKLFIDPGTPVAVESPTYLAALQVFRFFAEMDGCGQLRLNFSHATTTQAESGLAKLASLVRGFP
jgi:DNA-binding transcriptional MocR family regulator